MKEAIKYSSILQDFSRPLLNEKDSDEMFLKKMKVAEVIWNYCIAKEFNLSVFVELDKIITEQNQIHPSMKQVFDEFVKYKKTDFDGYKHFIHKVEYRINSKGIKTLYIESIHPKHLKNKV